MPWIFFTSLALLIIPSTLRVVLLHPKACLPHHPGHCICEVHRCTEDTVTANSWRAKRGAVPGLWHLSRQVPLSRLVKCLSKRSDRQNPQHPSSLCPTRQGWEIQKIYYSYLVINKTLWVFSSKLRVHVSFFMLVIHTSVSFSVQYFSVHDCHGGIYKKIQNIQK